MPLVITRKPVLCLATSNLLFVMMKSEPYLVVPFSVLFICLFRRLQKLLGDVVISQGGVGECYIGILQGFV